MIYPTIAEYVDAILSAEDNLDKLSNLRPVLDGNGRPVMSSGNYAVVFKMTDGDKYYALKCFTKEQEGRDEAYRMIVDELEFVQSSYIVPIKYIPNELFVSSNNTDVEEFPVVQIEWVEGENLDAYIRNNINDEYALNLLAYQFSHLAMWLLSQPFAHGDLKPDNTLVRPDGTLVLVDYDGMYVPAMRGMKSREMGSPDYCHPLRTADDFNEHTDDFSIAVIALSLKAIALNPDLLNKKSDGSLIFHSADYRDLSKCEAISSIHSLLNNSEIERLYSLFLLAHSQNELPPSSFRLFTLERPEKPEYEDLSTEVTEEDIENGVTDEYGVVYSKDGKRLLKALNNFEEDDNYIIKDGTIIICNYAFYWRVLGQIDIPNSVTTIGNFAFSFCCYFLKIDIPNSVTSIGKGAFSSCNSLEQINIPNSVITIGDWAFSDCSSLQKINIPNSVVKILGNPFGICNKLNLLSDSPSFTVKDNILYDKSLTILISCCSLQSEVKIPNSVKIIGTNAFSRCKCKYINIPNSVTTIQEGAFSGCSFEQINIPNSVTTIEDAAFYGCSSLKQIKIPNSVIEIKGNPFYCCYNLSIFSNSPYFTVKDNVLYDKSLTTLISCCSSETEIKIPDSVTTIGKKAFYASTPQIITIPNSVTTIGDMAFSTKLFIRQIIIPNSVTTIGNAAFSDCMCIEQISFSDRVTSIGKDIFRNSLLKKIYIPKGMLDYFKNLLPEELHSKLVEQ